MLLNQQSIVSSSGLDTCVHTQDTYPLLLHPSDGRKAISAEYCVMHEQNPVTLIGKRKGLPGVSGRGL